MEQQRRAFEELGLDTVLVCNSKKGVVVDGKTSHRYRHRSGLWSIANHYGFFWKAVLEQVPEGHFDIVYIRYPGSSPMFLEFLRRLRRKYRDTKIIVEVATYPFRGEMKSVKQKLILLSDDISSPFLRRYVSRIVTFYGQETIYGISCYQTENGIDPASHPLRKHLPKGSVLRLLGVANVSEWHGYDRLIRGIADDPLRAERSLEFHIAGSGSEIPRLKALASDLGIRDAVIFHGQKSGDELSALFNQSDLAVGSLGLHRLNLDTVSPLKTREYCARGIPFVYAGNDADFADDWPYALKLSSDDSDVDIPELRGFAKSSDQEATGTVMREYAHEHLSWKSKLCGLVQSIT